MLASSLASEISLSVGNHAGPRVLTAAPCLAQCSRLAQCSLTWDYRCCELHTVRLLLLLLLLLCFQLPALRHMLECACCPTSWPDCQGRA